MPAAPATIAAAFDCCCRLDASSSLRNATLDDADMTRRHAAFHYRRACAPEAAKATTTRRQRTCALYMLAFISPPPRMLYALFKVLAIRLMLRHHEAPRFSDVVAATSRCESGDAVIS